MKRDSERGRWGRWLRQERTKRGLSAEQVRAMIGERGFRVSESAYAEWESGYKKQPARDAIPILTDMWGSEPPPEPVEGQSDSDLASVLAEIRDELRLSRLAADRNADVLAQLLGVVLVGRLPQSETGAAADAPVALGSPQR